MARAAVVAKGGDGVREEFDASRRRLQGVSLRVSLVGGEQHRRIVWDRKLSMTNFPEGVEARQVDMVLGGLLPGEVIEMRTAAIRRARARIVGAGICVMAAAQAASLGVPSLSPMT
jgi:hypothetical protein